MESSSENGGAQREWRRTAGLEVTSGDGAEQRESEALAGTGGWRRAGDGGGRGWRREAGMEGGNGSEQRNFSRVTRTVAGI